MPGSQLNVKVSLTTDERGFDRFEIAGRHLPPNRDFTIFLLEQAGAPFGAAEYIGDFSTDAYGNTYNNLKLIVGEAFASTLVNGTRHARRPEPHRRLVRGSRRRRLLPRRNEPDHAVRRRQLGGRAGVQLGQRPAASGSVTTQRMTPVGALHGVRAGRRPRSACTTCAERRERRASGYITPGSERAVSTTPSTVMITALATGSTCTTRP